MRKFSLQRDMRSDGRGDERPCGSQRERDSVVGWVLAWFGGCVFRFGHQVFLGLVCTPYEFVLIVLIIPPQKTKTKTTHLSLTIAQLSSVSYSQKLKWGTDGTNSHSGLSDHDSCGLRMSIVSPDNAGPIAHVQPFPRQCRSKHGARHASHCTVSPF